MPDPVGGAAAAAPPATKAPEKAGTDPAVVSVPAAIPGELIRKFDHAGIQASIDKALASIPPGKSIAVVAHADTTGQVRASVAWRIGDEWSVVGVLKHTPDSARKIDGEAAVVWSR